MIGAVGVVHGDEGDQSMQDETKRDLDHCVSFLGEGGVSVTGRSVSPQHRDRRTKLLFSPRPSRRAALYRLELLGLVLFLVLVMAACGPGPVRTRPGEGRLVALPWAEAGVRPGAPTRALLKAEAKALRALETTRTAVTLRDHALILLQLGETDRAVAELSAATQLSPTNAVVWSDLAAARLHQSALHSDPNQILRALS